MNPQILKPVTSSQALLHIKSYSFDCLFRILRSIKMKFGQILVQLMTNIFSLFLTLLWRLETSPKSFYGFSEMTI